MNSPAILEYDDHDGRHRKFRVSPGQSVLIGSSNSADLKLTAGQKVAAQHCEITFRDNQCSIRSMHDQAPVLVNDKPIKDARLNNGDQIKLGSQQLLVRLESPQPRTGNPKSSAAPPILHAHAPDSPDANQPDPETEPPIEPSKFEHHDNGVFSCDVENLSEIMQLFAAHPKHPWTFATLVNHRLSGIDAPPPTELNLLKQQSDDAPDPHDLHLITDPDPAVVVEFFEKYHAAKSATLLLLAGELNVEKLTKEIALIANWFAEPNELEFVLTRGTEFLIGKIFSLADVIVVPKTSAEQLVLVHTHSDVEDLSALGDWIGASQPTS